LEKDFPKIPKGNGLERLKLLGNAQGEQMRDHLLAANPCGHLAKK
jgi:hypothetical protein